MPQITTSNNIDNCLMFSFMEIPAKRAAYKITSNEAVDRMPELTPCSISCGGVYSRTRRNNTVTPNTIQLTLLFLVTIKSSARAVKRSSNNAITNENVR